MTLIFGNRRGKSLIPFSDQDAEDLYSYPETEFLKINISGSKYEFSYRQLCLYWSSCTYISEHFSDNPNMNHKNKIDHRTRLECGFIKGTYFDHNGLLQWIPDDLNRANCHQKKRQDYISEALELHAELIGIFDVEEYKKLLESQ